ncbi:glycosyltransferase [bacterium]|nr:glycosyltransferase [bacterium]
MDGYNVVIPDICQKRMAEITLPVMDALQSLGHTPTVLNLASIVQMYQEYRYQRHACYEIFGFYFQDLMKRSQVDFGFCVGLSGMLEDVSKHEVHNLLDEAGIPNVMLVHSRDTQSLLDRLEKTGARDWRHTIMACTSRIVVEALLAAGYRNATYCPPGANTRLFYPTDQVPENAAYPLLDDQRLSRGFDASFIGTWTPGREALLLPLQEAGVNLGIFGDKNWERTPLGVSYGGPANYLSEVNTIYNASKINLDLPHEATKLDDYISFRVHDCLASGSFLLAYPRQGHESLWEAGQEQAGSYAVGELLEAVQHYLAHPTQRAQIAQRGYEAVLRDHTWQQRLKAIILPGLELRLLKAAAA